MSGLLRACVACGVFLAVCAEAGLARAAEPAAFPVQPTAVRKLVANGKHNAFTALTRFQDTWLLAYREAPSHAYGEADIVLLTSPDTEQWTEAQRFNFLPDDRDPQFLNTGKRLFLYDLALQGPALTTFVTYTDDGKTWSKQQPVYEPRFCVWKPIIHGDTFYATSHKKVEGSAGGAAREVHLIRSTDGLKWEKVSTIRAGNWESETTLFFEKDQRLTAFLRTKYSVAGSILSAEAPYTEWTERKVGTHFSGHAIHTFRDVNYLLSRSMDPSGKNQSLVIYTWADNQLTPYCQLPSGGDCSYAEAVELGDQMLISYYSTHEGMTNIYLARVPLKKTND